LPNVLRNTTNKISAPFVFRYKLNIKSYVKKPLKIFNPKLLIVCNTLLLIALIEIVSYGFLRYTGINSALFITMNTNTKLPRSGHGTKFTSFDPHLGYAYGKNAHQVKTLNTDFTWVDGFVVYDKKTSALQHPVVLCLGGSTTDGVAYGHSWPEELSNILKTNGVGGTIVNGGTGGYTTNQEILKLIRDGLEFKPDIIISYSGFNDKGRYGSLPHPMVHSFQRELLKTLVKRSQPKFLPSTLTLLQRLSTSNTKPKPDYTLGIKSSLGLAEQYKKNITLMNVISHESGARFLAFIQPFAFYKSIHASNPNLSKGEKYKHEVSALYNKITLLPNEFPYIYDATQIFETHANVYKKDGVHLQDTGDKVVAHYIYSKIEPFLSKTKKLD